MIPHYEIRSVKTFRKLQHASIMSDGATKSAPACAWYYHFTKLHSSNHFQHRRFQWCVMAIYRIGIQSYIRHYVISGQAALMARMAFACPFGFKLQFLVIF
jgi:hypothetical protein